MGASGDVFDDEAEAAAEGLTRRRSVVHSLGGGMIELHRLNGSVLFLNHRHIEILEASPDTVITLTNEHKYLVREKPAEIAAKISAFERKIFQDLISERPK